MTSGIQFAGRTVAHPNPVAAVVFLHGYAMTEENFAPFAESLRFPGVFYFPHGNFNVVSDDGTSTGYSWWPPNHAERAARQSRGIRSLVDVYPEGLDQACVELTKLAQSVRLAHPALPLAVIGFSQGGMLASHALFCAGLQIDGLALLSSSRIAFDRWKDSSVNLGGLLTLVTHGRRDTVLAPSEGRALCDFYQSRDVDLKIVEFDGDHNTPLVIWRAIRKFLERVASSKRHP